MKKFFSLAALMFGFASLVSAQKLTLLWQTDTLLRVPESVLFDEKNKVLYVANIDGKPDEKDGKGFISQVGLDGKIKNLEWVTGLDAPKGMGLSGTTLYVADVTKVAIIDITTGKIINTLEIEGSKFLNDITIDGKGNVYVSDSSNGKIYKVSAGNIETYFETAAFKSPNGLLALDDGLYIADFGTGAFYKLDWEKKLTKIGDTITGADGIVQTSKGHFIVSRWHGQIHAIDSKGVLVKLLDTKEQQINSADVDYNAKEKTLYIPTFFKNTVVAYTLSK